MQPFMVVFVERGRPDLLGRYDDKGTARRAWMHCKEGAALAESNTGLVLEFKGGTPQRSESKLVSHALKVARETPREAPPPEPAPVEATPVVVEPATGAEVAEELRSIGRECGITPEVADAMCREIGDPVSDAEARAGALDTSRSITSDEASSVALAPIDAETVEQPPAPPEPPAAATVTPERPLCGWPERCPGRAGSSGYCGPHTRLARLRGMIPPKSADTPVATETPAPSEGEALTTLFGELRALIEDFGGWEKPRALAQRIKRAGGAEALLDLLDALEALPG